MLYSIIVSHHITLRWALLIPNRVLLNPNPHGYGGRDLGRGHIYSRPFVNASGLGIGAKRGARLLSRLLISELRFINPRSDLSEF